MKYSAEQEHVIDRVLEWLQYGGEEPRLTLGGYAGTGKTTVIKEIVKQLGKDQVRVAAFTGKAASVLQSKGVEATTLHRLMYSPAEYCTECGLSPEACESRNAKNRAIIALNPDLASKYPSCPQPAASLRWARVPALKADLVIIDEASMLTKRLMADIERFGRPVLYVGDHGQLEPVGSDPELMVNPDLRLEQIHRQAEGSSIIRFAHRLRRGELPQYCVSDDQVVIGRGEPARIERFDAVLCGYNRTRVAVNAKIRRRRGFSGPGPQPGERVICLQNDRERGVFNGMLATVTDVHLDCMSVVDDFGSKLEGLPFLPHQFGHPKTLEIDREEDLTLWDWGYAMTVHKAQGSEWDNVCVLEELAPMWTAKRWRYTAATRAARRITYCTSNR